MDAARPTAAPGATAGRVRRGARRALTAGVLVPAISLAIAAPAYAAVTAVTGGATGISASVTGTVGLSLAGTPSVTLPTGGSASPITQSTASVNGAPLLTTGVLNVSTQGTPAGGSVTSSASVNNTALVGLLGANLLTAGVISSTCTSDESGSTGSSTITGLTALGQPITVGTGANQNIPIVGLGTLHINEQIVAGTAPSSSIIVNALRVELTLGPIAAGNVIIGRSECGVTSDGAAVPTGAIGGVLLTGLAAVGFVGHQFSRRRRGPGTVRG